MVTPLDFMERVLVWPGPEGPGWANLHWKLTVTGQDGKPRPAWRGQPFKTAGSLINRAQRLCMDKTKAEDIYFCLSTQAQCDQWTLNDGRVINIAKRDSANVLLLKAIWLDVDVKAPPAGYTDQKEAKKAILDFCTAAGLPLPSALVNSGGGVHVYWISRKPLTVDEWRPFAEGLRAEAERLGLRCDLGVTTDSARILRMPGTFNRKIAGQDRPVVVTALGVDYDFDADLGPLKKVGAGRVTAAVTKQAPFDLTAFPQGAMHSMFRADPKIRGEVETGNGGFTDLRIDLPLKVDNVIRECGHFRDAAMNRGVGHSQGLWMNTVLASTWLEDGYTWAKRFSDKYPTYDEGELKAMWERKLDDRAKMKLGWPSCRTFETEGCKACSSCKWRGQIKSPLSLADRVQPDPPPGLPLPTTLVTPNTKAVVSAQDLGLPNGYTLTNGSVFAMVEDKENPKGPRMAVQLLAGEILSRPRVTNEIPPKFFFKYRHGVNYIDVSIPLPALASDQKLMDALYTAGVHVCVGADKIVRKFMRSFSAKLDAAILRMETAPLGWIYDAGKRVGFAYGGKIYKHDGTEEESATARGNITKFVGPCGDARPIFDAMAMISDEHRPDLEAMLLQSWVSPMLELAGLNSASVVWGWGSSGGHKSAALNTGAALWYMPKVMRERGGATIIGLENKMHTLRNLPVILDEMTDPREIESVEAIFNRIQEGGQGSRGAKDGGNRDPKSWQLTLVCGSNQSLYDYFDRKHVQTDAKAQRIFEIIVIPRDGKRDRTYAMSLIGSLEHNYGHLGVAYSKYLVMNFERLKQEYEKLAAMVETDLAYPATGKLADRGRFWQVTVALTLLAARVANEICGKEFFHFDEIKPFLYACFKRNRKWVETYVVNAGSKSHTSEAWAKVARMWINNQLATDIMHNGGGRPQAVVNVYCKPPVDRGQPVLMHWVKTPALLRIAEQPLKDLLNELELGLGAYERFQQDFGGKVTRKIFLAGMPVQDTKTRINVWEIPINEGHPLYNEWADKVLHVAATGASAAAQAQDAVTAAVTGATP